MTDTPLSGHYDNDSRNWYGRKNRVHIWEKWPLIPLVFEIARHDVSFPDEQYVPLQNLKVCASSSYVGKL